jgi:hypothetical protein
MYTHCTRPKGVCVYNVSMAKKDDRIDLRVPAGTKDIWEVEAERRGVKVSEAIRRAMPIYFEHVPAKRQRTRA